MRTFDLADWHGLVATARSLPLDRVATALGYRRDVRDKVRWKRPGSVLGINGEKFLRPHVRDGRRRPDQPGDARSRRRLPRCRRLPVGACASLLQPARRGGRGCSGRSAAARPPRPVGGLLARGARSPCHGTRHRRDAAPGLPRPRAGLRGPPWKACPARVPLAIKDHDLSFAITQTKGDQLVRSNAFNGRPSTSSNSADPPSRFDRRFTRIPDF